MRTLVSLAAAGFLAATAASAGTIVINTDTSDPAPKAAFQALIDGFKATAHDGTMRGRANLVGQPTVMWFFPAANMFRLKEAAAGRLVESKENHQQTQRPRQVHHVDRF